MTTPSFGRTLLVSSVLGAVGLVLSILAAVAALGGNLYAMIAILLAMPCVAMVAGSRLGLAPVAIALALNLPLVAGALSMLSTRTSDLYLALGLVAPFAASWAAAAFGAFRRANATRTPEP